MTSEAGQKRDKAWQLMAFDYGQKIPLGSSLLLGMGRREHVGL